MSEDNVIEAFNEKVGGPEKFERQSDYNLMLGIFALGWNLKREELAALRDRVAKLESVEQAAHELMGEIGSQWDLSEGHADHVLETDLSYGAMKQLADALDGHK